FAVGGARQVGELLGERSFSGLLTGGGEPVTVFGRLEVSVGDDPLEIRGQSWGGDRQKSCKLGCRGRLGQPLGAHPVHRLEDLALVAQLVADKRDSGNTEVPPEQSHPPAGLKRLVVRLDHDQHRLGVLGGASREVLRRCLRVEDAHIVGGAGGGFEDATDRSVHGAQSPNSGMLGVGHGAGDRGLSGSALAGDDELHDAGRYAASRSASPMIALPPGAWASTSIGASPSRSARRIAGSSGTATSSCWPRPMRTDSRSASSLSRLATMITCARLAPIWAARRA